MERTPDRRQFLRGLALGGAVAVAGCGGGDGDPATGTTTGDDSTTDGERTTAGDDTLPAAEPGPFETMPPEAEDHPVCSDLAGDAAEFEAFDIVESDLFVTFAHPADWDTGVIDDPPVGDYVAGIVNGSASLSVRTYYPVADEDFVAEKTSQADYDAITYEYDGETRTAALTETPDNFDGTQLSTTVPGPDGSLHEVQIRAYASDADCQATLTALATAILASLEPNPDTTFESV